ncbi:MAG: S-layer homology domain-containing protein [Clostridia bacterium]|nr:S-layer homology domain-containing protein [Clostridia bacterium]
MVLALPVFASTYTESKYKDAANINADCEEAIELVSVLNIMQGDDKGNFNPNGFITRAEVAKMIYVILNGKDDKGVNYKNGNLFTDVAGHWAEGYINYAGMTKLVQGYGNGKFGPNEPIATAEVAKMLLTTIGYSAEVRGYIGANWDKNVLSDAAIIGLLKGYDYPTTGYAPRQWVAVMFANAMYALTYKNMAAIPYTGMLTSTSGSGAAAADIVTMMEKYFNVVTVEAVAYATDSASIDRYKTGTNNNGEPVYKYFAGSGKVLFSNGSEYKGSGIGAADLGQKYRLYVKDNKVLGKTCLSDTYEVRLLDIKTEVKYNISDNQAANKYVFDFDGTKLTFANKNLNALETGVAEHTDAEYFETVTPVALYNSTLGNIDLQGNTRFVGNELVKAIDTNCDGKIDYLFVTNYGYAEITEAGNHKKYGDYVYAMFSEASAFWFNEGNAALEYNNEERLYIDSCIITKDTLAKDNIIRVHWDLDNWQYVMEVLPMHENVKFEEINNKALAYTFGGDVYQVASMGAVDFGLLVKANLDEDFDLVYDGNLLVWVGLSDRTNKSLDAINNNIVLVLDVDDEYSHGSIREDMAIEYMTIDGETHTAIYDNDYALNKGGVDFEDLKALSQDDGLNGGEYTVEGRLFRIKAVGKKVALFEISGEVDQDGVCAVNVDFNVAKSIADGYTILDLNETELDATGATKMLKGDAGNYKLVNENVYFYAYTKKAAEPTAKNTVYGVIKAEELGKGTAEEAYAQIFTKSAGYRVPSAVAGYIFANLDGYTSGDWLIVRSDPRTNSNGTYVKVEFSDGKQDTIYVDNIQYYQGFNGYVTLSKNQFCYYIYNAIEKTYDLWVMPARSTAIVDYDEKSYTVYTSREIDGQEVVDTFKLGKDTVIAISQVTFDRNENSQYLVNEATFFNFVFGGMDDTKFVARDELTLDMIEFGAQDHGYTQMTFYTYDEAKDVFYVYVMNVMDQYFGSILDYMAP